MSSVKKARPAARRRNLVATADKVPRRTRAEAAPPAPIDPTHVLAREIMRGDVLVLTADVPVRSAAELLEDSGSNGAAVADASGQLIGVLTKSDIARSDHLADDGSRTRRAHADVGADDSEDDEDEEVYSTDEYDDEILGRLRVGDWMTHGVIQVGPQTTVAVLCRRMLDEGIHRVFVVERDKLLGVVETDDVMRLLAGPASPARSKRA